MAIDASKIGSVENLLLNLSGGLLPENLTSEEVKVLEKEYGPDWFEKMGYTEPEYKRPSF